MSLRHLQHLLPTRSIVNAFFKSMLKLLFFKKFKIQKNNKNLNLQGTKYENKEVKGAIYFLSCLVTKFAWRLSN